MKTNFVVSLCLAGLLAVAAVVWAESSDQAPAAGKDPRIDKLIQQNEQILKNQDDILKKIDEIQGGMAILKRRTG